MANTPAPHRPAIAGLPGFRPYLPEADIEWLTGRFAEILRTGQLTKGPFVLDFESALAERLGGDVEVVAVANATLALEALYRTIGVAGGEVVVPANTFVATASAARAAGARVRFVDIDATTICPTPEQVDAAIGPDTRLVVLCPMGGLISPDVPELVSVCARRGVACVEDSAQALGVTLAGRPAGTFGRAGVFSFFMGKVATTGEGGAVVTCDAGLAEAVRELRDQGRGADRVHHRPGFNWRMTEMQAVLGVAQLRRLDEILAERARLASVYTDELGGIDGIELPRVAAGVRPNWYKYWLTLPSPAVAGELADLLQTEDGLRQAGPLQGHLEACSTMPAFADAAGHTPVADEFCARHIGLPLYPGLPESAVKAVAAAVRRHFEKISASVA
jgi:perosamine synthetase